MILRELYKDGNRYERILRGLSCSVGRSGGKVLEIGCGRGSGMYYLNQRYGRGVEGITLPGDMEYVYPSQIGRVRAMNMLVEGLPDNLYSSIISVYGLIYAREPEDVQFISGLLGDRLTKNGLIKFNIPSCRGMMLCPSASSVVFGQGVRSFVSVHDWIHQLQKDDFSTLVIPGWREDRLHTIEQVVLAKKRNSPVNLRLVALLDMLGLMWSSQGDKLN